MPDSPDALSRPAPVSPVPVSPLSTVPSTIVADAPAAAEPSPIGGAPTADALEARITALRADVRRAVARGDRASARVLRAELRDCEHAWDAAVIGEAADGRPAHSETAPAATGGVGTAGVGTAGMVPVREQVHHALTLLGVPAAPKLISAVHDAFHPHELPAGRLASLRRDEERSFRSAPYARPFYLCAALTADLLAPARGLLTISTWPLHRRVIGPLSPRTDFLTAAIRVAERAEAQHGHPSPALRRLLWRFAANIPGAADTTGVPGSAHERAARGSAAPVRGTAHVPDAAGVPGAAAMAGSGEGTAAGFAEVRPGVLLAAARTELAVHAEADARHRAAAAERADRVLDDAARLFGSRLAAVGGRGGTSVSAHPQERTAQ